MAWLDDILLGRRTQNQTIRNFFSPQAVARSGVVAQNAPGVLTTSQRGTDPATIGAATALLRTTGTLPQTFGQRIQPSSHHFYSNEKIYQKLVDAGVQQGTPVSKLYEILGGRTVGGNNVSGGNTLAALFAAMVGSGQYEQGSAGAPDGGSSGGQTGGTAADWGNSTQTTTAPTGGLQGPQTLAQNDLQDQIRAGRTPLTFGPGMEPPTATDALGLLLRRFQGGLE